MPTDSTAGPGGVTAATSGGKHKLFTKESLAWIWYDLGTTGFNSVVVTFVFSVYLTSSSFGPGDEPSKALGIGMAVAAAIVALMAPVLGHRADRAGRPVLWLGITSTVVLVIICALWFIKPAPQYLWPGIAALAIATVFSEFSGVNYNSLLKRVSTPDTVGRISAIGWGSGYIGSIVLLIILLFVFIMPEVGAFGVTMEDGLKIRACMLVTALWYVMGMAPILAVLRDEKAAPGEGQARPSHPSHESLLGSYRALWDTIRHLAQTSPNTLFFLVASAIFRDGLVGVFSFGGVLAQGSFGFTAQGVIIFAIAANLVAGVATVSMGVLDDILGPKRLIIISLAIMIVAGLGVFLLHDRGAMVFWVLGLTLCIFVGPAQSASRTLLTRLIPPGDEGKIFGLYATTGRALSFIAPAAWTASIALGESVRPGEASSQYWGILGIVSVLLVGLLALLPVKAHRDMASGGAWETEHR